MGVGYDDGTGPPPTGDPLKWDYFGASNLQVTITPAMTVNTVPTCYEFYVPPTNSIGHGDLWQPNAGTPWIVGWVDHPILNVSEGVIAPEQISPSSYHDDLEDCVAGTAFPQV